MQSYNSQNAAENNLRCRNKAECALMPTVAPGVHVLGRGAKQRRREGAAPGERPECRFRGREEEREEGMYGRKRVLR